MGESMGGRDRLGSRCAACFAWVLMQGAGRAVRSHLQSLLVALLMAVCVTPAGAVDCKKSLAVNTLLSADVVEIRGEPERFALVLTSDRRDVYPGARIRIALKASLTPDDVACLEQHAPILFIDGYRLPRMRVNYQPAVPAPSKPPPAQGQADVVLPATSMVNGLEFVLERTDASKETWLKFHRHPRPDRRVEVGVGFDVAADGVPPGIELRRLAPAMQTEKAWPMRAGIAPPDAYYSAWVGFFLILAGSAILAIMLRENFKHEGERSDGAVQAYAWFALVLAMAVHLWLLTGAVPVPSAKLLGLMGVAGATLAIATQLNRKNKTDRGSPKRTSGIHVWQSGMVNVFLMLAFIVQSHETIVLSDVDATWIGVLAICNGVYMAVGSKANAVL